MKNIKRFLFVLLSAIMALAIPFTAACKTTDEPEQTQPPAPAPAVTTELLSIELDTTGATKEYYVGQYFNTRGIVVTATTKRSDRETTSTRDVTNEALIDSSEFRNNRVGEYNIKVSYTLGGTTKEASFKVSVVDVKLSLDFTNVNKGIDGTIPYLLGEDFSSEGLIVNAQTIKPDAEPVSENVSDKVVVDSSKYDNTKKGVYPITVTYNAGVVVRTATYNVTVDEARDGLEVKLAEGVSDTIVLTKTNPTASIDTSKIVVRTVDNYGNVITGNEGLVDITDCTVEVYNAATKLKAADLSSLGAGAYQIWVTKESDKLDGYTLKGFALVYVVDEIAEDGLNFVSGTTEQVAIADRISSTWQFKATYGSGKEVNLTSKDVTIDINTKEVGDNKKATVTYSYKNSKGEIKTATCEVTYTIKERPAQTQDETYTLNYRVNSAANGMQTTWLNDKEDYDEFVKISSTITGYQTNKPRTTADGTLKIDYYGEVKAFSSKGVTIDVGARASDVTIKVYANTGTVGRKIFLATATTETDASKIVGSIEFTDSNKNDLCVITANNLAAGKYYVFSNNTTVGLYGIDVTYTVKLPKSGEETVTSIDFTDTSKIAANSTLAGSSATGLVAITDKSNNETGFSVTKCGSDGKNTEIAAKNSVQCLVFQGTGKIEQNSLAVKVGAGNVTVEMKYFNNNADRYMKVLNTGLDTAEATTEEKTTADQAIKTRTVTFKLTEETVIYLGSADKGLYVAGIKVTVVTEAAKAEPVVANISTLYSNIDTETKYAEELTIVEGSISVLAATGSEVAIDKNGKEIDGLTFTHRLKLNGKGTATAKSIKIVTKGAATITVYGMSGKSSENRTLALYDSGFNAIEGQAFTNDGTDIAKGTFTVNAEGTFYLGATNGFNVYYIAISYGV